MGNGTVLANATSIKRDVMYTFVETSNCVPQITDLSSEFVSNNVMVISSVANVTSVRVACNTSAIILPVDAP
jgi:hypothetical protein